MAATTFHSVIIVFWKETAFPRWRAMDRRWKRNSDSLVSSVTTVMRLPISCVTSMAVSCHAPAVSMANGQKMWVLANLVYLSVLLCAPLWAAAPGLTAVLLILLFWFFLLHFDATIDYYCCRCGRGLTIANEIARRRCEVLLNSLAARLRSAAQCCTTLHNNTCCAKSPSVNTTRQCAGPS